MTVLIKANDAASQDVRPQPLHERSAPQPTIVVEPESVVPVELIALRHEVESLGRLNAQQESELERLRNDVGRAYREGESEGRKAGRREADARREEQLSMLDTGIRGAVAQFAEQLSSLEHLAAFAAREGLSAILDDPAQHANLLAGAIRRQFEQLEAASIVQVAVSADEFDDPDALAALVDAIGRKGLSVQPTTDLKQGQCTIQLRLGALEVGVSQQWDRLKAELDAMTDQELEA